MKGIFFSLALGLVSSSAWAVTMPFSETWLNASTEGTKYDSADHADAIFVFEAMGNFCPACNANAKNVNDLAASYAKNARVQVLDVSSDSDADEQQSWIRRNEPNHPVVDDSDSTLWSQFGSRYIPTTFITDCHGKEQYKHVGVWKSQDITSIHKVIDKLLKTKCKPTTRHLRKPTLSWQKSPGRTHNSHTNLNLRIVNG